jgi:lipopolysaccharide biosynthesis glycosyltransferase
VAAATTDAHVVFYMLRPPSLSIDLAALKKALDRSTFTLRDCLVEDDFSDLCSTRQYTPAMYYRFVLPKHVESDRVIYLDSDMMVRRSLTSLYDTDLGGHVIAACKDYSLLHQMRDYGIPLHHLGQRKSVRDYCREVVGLNLATTDYFNTGVLVMDLARWQAQRISERCLAFCRGHEALVMADQDAANHVIQGAFARLDPRWNAFSYMRDEFPPVARRARQDIFGGYGATFTEPAGEWRDVLAAWAFDPWIVHFVYKSKPWNYAHRRTAYDQEFWALAAQTPFEADLRRQFRESRRRARMSYVPRTLLQLAVGRRGPLRRFRSRPHFYA